VEHLDELLVPALERRGLRLLRRDRVPVLRVEVADHGPRGLAHRPRDLLELENLPLIDLDRVDKTRPLHLQRPRALQRLVLEALPRGGYARPRALKFGLRAVEKDLGLLLLAQVVLDPALEIRAPLLNLL